QTARVRELAEVRPVRPHGEDLPAVGIAAKRVAARVEEHRLCRHVLPEQLDAAAGAYRQGEVATGTRVVGLLGMRQLPQIGTGPVDGEYLTIVRWIAPERIGRGGQEDRFADDTRMDPSVRQMEAGEL